MPFVNIPDRSAADIVASADINSLMGNSKYNADNLNYLRNGTVGVYDLNIYAGAGLSYANEIDIHTKSNPLTSLGYNLWVGKGTAAPTGTADNDTSIGYNALVNVTHGSKDVAFGNGALHDLTEGNYDAAFGTYALYGLTTGSYNFGGGYYAGKDLTTGSKNTFLGANTGHGITTGSSNTIIGANVTGLSSSLANNIILADGDGNQRLKIDSANNITFGAMTLVGSVAKGDIYYASDTNVLSKLSKPASTLYLTMDSDGVPAWAAGGAGGTVSVTAPLTGDGSAGDPLTVGTSLTSLAALSYVSTAFVKMTAANTFALDTTVYVPLNGALGTPSSGTVTNLTGTASININGTVGATTPAAGAFTNIIIADTDLLTWGGLYGAGIPTLWGSTGAQAIIFNPGGSTTGEVARVNAQGIAITNLGTAALPSLYFGTDTNTGAWSPGADTYAISTGGVERLRVTDTGVGIGIASPINLLQSNLVSGVSAATSGSSANGNLRLSATDTSLICDFGVVGSPAHGWIQVRVSGNYATNWPLVLNPNGSNVLIGGTATRGTTAGSKILSIFDGTAPAGLLTNGISIYSVGGVAYVMDASGTGTRFSGGGDPTYSINAQTGTTYTLQLTDTSKLVTCENASTITVTVPKNSSVAFEIGTKIDIVQKGAGKVTIAPVDGDVTISSKGGLKSSGGQYVGLSLVKVATNVWYLFGLLVA